MYWENDRKYKKNMKGKRKKTSIVIPLIISVIIWIIMTIYINNREEKNKEIMKGGEMEKIKDIFKQSKKGGEVNMIEKISKEIIEEKIRKPPSEVLIDVIKI